MKCYLTTWFQTSNPLKNFEVVTRQQKHILIQPIFSLYKLSWKEVDLENFHQTDH
jgi:hypothetical protein